jgi:uncharacterized protein (TIGR03118 family)
MSGSIVEHPHESVRFAGNCIVWGDLEKWSFQRFSRILDFCRRASGYNLSHQFLVEGRTHMRSRSVLIALGLGAALLASASAQTLPGYTQTNLVTNSSDPDLQTPWGLTESPTSPFWVADNGDSVATLYNGNASKVPLTVSIPNPPTGDLFNSSTTAFNGDQFIFATSAGTIAGWRGGLGTSAETLFTAAGARYTGLANANNTLYAANFTQNRIDVYNSSGPVSLPGNFTDPNLPAGFSPFNVAAINGEIYVAYAQSAGGNAVHGTHNGVIAQFDTQGNFLGEFANGGALNAPWGMTLAPAGFGLTAGDLIVGNSGDGKINVYSSSGTFLGTIADTSNQPIANDGLMGLTFGNDSAGGNANSLYLVAGGSSGLLAQIDVPEPVALPAILLLGLFKRRRSL